MRKYTNNENNLLERSEFNWIEWQILKFKAFLGIIPTYSEEEKLSLNIFQKIRKWCIEKEWIRLSGKDFNTLYTETERNEAGQI